ncbi:hypothetical protein AVEN_151506-1 [Araneus ventricosus]|uniref:Uncharacterized protein n=1 Tax=Araneus ventricosus TaxID=182803 RepID=A0A4Y2ITM9_ARAVE|nr:hypothetical protein AVEN_151506-1 [Araneus ventricosus]
MISGVILRMETHYLTKTILAQIFLLMRPQSFSQSELNDLVRYLGLSKDGAELLGNNGDKEKVAWDSFKDVVHRCLRNTKDSLYKTIVQRMLTAYEAEGCKMSLKAHFLHSHIDCFPENLELIPSEEKSARFHQDVRDIEKRYQVRWDFNMLAGYCWMLSLETEDGKRKRVWGSVQEKKKRFHKQKE